MKTLFVSILIIVFIYGCKKNENDSIDNPEYKIIDDIYLGNYSCQGTKYGSAISFQDSTYFEVYLGGIYFTKLFTCCSYGKFPIEKERLVFKLDSFKFGEPSAVDCVPDVLLPGEYTINKLTDDSLMFERGTEENRIVYTLGRTYSEL